MGRVYAVFAVTVLVLISPYAVLAQSAQADSYVQPVHYYWRAADFLERHFGNQRAYGLIAQDVERVLPELVVTNDDGFKAIGYSKLPLLTIQAVKELKAENDALKQRVAQLEPLKTENDALKQRVTEIEPLITELLATTGRR